MDKTVAVIGGTGNLGAALARRWASAGVKIVIGSRDGARAQASAAEIGHGASGTDNAAAAALADIVVLAVPFAAQEGTIADVRDACAGKIVIDTTVPLNPPKVMRVQLPAEGCAAVRTQQLMGEAVTVISGFHNVAAHKLATEADVACDVLVFGDDKQARANGIALAEKAGLRGLHGGALVNSAAAEALTSVLIFLNKTYKVDGAGIRITGKLTAPEA
ncbi:NADPH-dependent F420 reductase [Novosphingobium pentaromativorans]|uniref:NADPH-dependent reductase n=1 Tax=Novosphingobium pentaromativorans US6-1 TaxID=1088721 RepID=G6E875_9SPHN|nr:NADPH-dependent F420 reductase [Novosphingobium pentaromativorans]EHJ62415.1 NADPH-dependent reductase [Novosphingobium pentaromativorans US6-1]